MALRETTIELDVLVDADPLRDLNNQINDIANNMQNMGNISASVNQDITHHFQNHGNNLSNMGNNLNGVGQGYGNLTQVTNHYYDTTNNHINNTNHNLFTTNNHIDNITNNMNQMNDSSNNYHNNANSHMGNHLNNLNHMSHLYSNLDDHAMAMLMNMHHGWSMSSQNMAPFLGNLIQAQHGFFQLAQGMHNFSGTNSQFMSQVDDLALALKAAQDAMINNNLHARQMFLQNIGLMRNMTTQASRISSEYRRMGNPFYNINQGGLAVANSLNRMANRGTAASLALARLGPTASMLALRNMTQMITQGLMRFQMVAIGAALASFILYKALHKASMENKEYANSFNTMVGNLRKAVQPMVDAFTAVMIPVYNFINALALLVIQFNEAHPLLAKIIQGIVMLIPALTLLLSPLAIGIGLFAGFHAAFASLWPIIGPVVTGLAAMSATVWLVAAAIVALVAGVVIMYNKFGWFRDFVNGVWASIKNAATVAWNFILNNVIIPVMNAMSAFFTTKLAQIKLFWALHGTEIMNIVKVYLAVIKGYITANMAVIKGVFQAVWPILSGIVKIAWAQMRIVISTAINLILGIIRVGMALLQGDWKGAWEAIKGTARAIWSDIRIIISSIDLFEIGRKIIEGLARGITSAVDGVVSAAKGVWNAIKGVFSGKSVSVPVSVKTNGGPVPQGVAPVAAKVGLGRVPYDGFAATLHKDEAVLTAKQSNTLRNAGMLKGEGLGPSLNMNASDSETSSVNSSDMPVSSSVTSNRSNSSLVFNPTFNFVGSEKDNKNVKQQFDDMKDEMFSYLTSMYDPGVDY